MRDIANSVTRFRAIGQKSTQIGVMGEIYTLYIDERGLKRVFGGRHTRHMTTLCMRAGHVCATMLTTAHSLNYMTFNEFLAGGGGRSWTRRSVSTRHFDVLFACDDGLFPAVCLSLRQFVCVVTCVIIKRWLLDKQIMTAKHTARHSPADLVSRLRFS